MRESAGRENWASESERTSVTPVQQLSPALKKRRDMDEAIPTRARMAICKNAEFFMSGDVS